MSVSQAIINEIKRGYKIPERVRVTPTIFNYLVLDKRYEEYKCDNFIIRKLNGIPLMIDTTLSKDYMIEY